MPVTPYMSRLRITGKIAYAIVVGIGKLAAGMAFLLSFWLTVAGLGGTRPELGALGFIMMCVTLYFLIMTPENWIRGTVYAAISCGVLTLLVHELGIVTEYRAMRAAGLLEPYGITRIVVPPVPMSAAQERVAASEAVAVVKALAEALPDSGPVHLPTHRFDNALRPFQGPKSRFSVSHDLGLGGYTDVLVLTPWGWQITAGFGLAPDLRDGRWDASWLRVAGVSSRACVILAEAFVRDPTVALLLTGNHRHVKDANIQRGCDNNHDHSVTLGFRRTVADHARAERPAATERAR